MSTSVAIMNICAICWSFIARFLIDTNANLLIYRNDFLVCKAVRLIPLQFPCSRVGVNNLLQLFFIDSYITSSRYVTATVLDMSGLLFFVDYKAVRIRSDFLAYRHISLPRLDISSLATCIIHRICFVCNINVRLFRRFFQFPIIADGFHTFILLAQACRFSGKFRA